ncbi:hypothetical protein [Cupriavidus sp. DF5525]|uniref:hypothetical protein n=1 Tax=Cupriavidus sp. DF5525 TaxID=3160989 RepID=UPI0032DFB758
MDETYMYDINTKRETPIVVLRVKYLNDIVEQDDGRRRPQCWPVPRTTGCATPPART